MKTRRLDKRIPLAGARPSLSHRVTAASAWQILGAAVTILVQTLVVAILARTLGPEEFGLVAQALVVTGLAAVLADSGVGAALVQAPVLPTSKIATAFWISLSAGLALAVTVVALAGAAGQVIGEARAVPLIRWLSSVFALQSVTSVPLSLLRRGLRFKIIAAGETISYTLAYGCVGVFLARIGAGVNALVAAAICQAALRLLFVVHFAPLCIRGATARDARDLARFGSNLTIARLMNYTARNIDYLIVGKALGAATLGIYSRAYQLMALPVTHLATTVSAVLAPAYAEMQADQRRMQRAFLDIVAASAALSAALFLVGAVAGREIFVCLFGPKWLDAVVPFKILCLAGPLRVATNHIDAFARGVGRVAEQAKSHTLYAIAVTILVAVGVRAGLKGVAVAVVFAVCLMYLQMMRLAKRALRFSLRDLMRAHLLVLPIAGLAVAGASGAGVITRGEPETLILFAKALCGLLGAAGGAFVAAKWKLLPKRLAEASAHLVSGQRRGKEAQ